MDEAHRILGDFFYYLCVCRPSWLDPRSTAFVSYVGPVSDQYIEVTLVNCRISESKTRLFTFITITRVCP